MPARAQPGRHSEPSFFRVYTPLGQLLTPRTVGYRVFVQDPGYSRTPSSVTFDTVASRYKVWIAPSLKGGEITAQFRVCIVHNRDTMRVFGPFGARGFVLDSIPYRPGTYRLSGGAYLASALLREVWPTARLKPGPRADWQYLQQAQPQSLPQVVAELVEIFPNASQQLDRFNGPMWTRQKQIYAGSMLGCPPPVSRTPLRQRVHFC